MKDQIPKLQEYYHQETVTSSTTPSAATSIKTSGLTSTSTSSVPTTSATSSLIVPPSALSPSDGEFNLTLRQWNYCADLMKYMNEEGLLDRQELLLWILDLLDKLRTQPNDDGILRLYLPLTLQVCF